MEDLSPYELLRLKRIEENRKILKELGLIQVDNPQVIRKTVQKPKNRPSLVSNGTTSVKNDETYVPRKSIRTRNSTRLSLLAGEDTVFENDLSEDEENTTATSRQNNVHRPNTYGAINGIPVGTTWKTRLECSSDGVHRPTVAGIHGSKDGAYSIALSGGYEDDLDFGEGFTYTGSGGRDLKGTAAKPKNLRVAPQSKDQKLDGVNASLAASVKSKLPIRVIRGYKCPGVYAPEEGYRYDGLYTAEKFWFATGLSGFKVVKFALKRLKDQDKPPWEVEQLVVQPQSSTKSPSPKKNINQNTSIETDEFNSSNIDCFPLQKITKPWTVSEILEEKSKSMSPNNIVTLQKNKTHLVERETFQIMPNSHDVERNTSLHENGISLQENELDVQYKEKTLNIFPKLNNLEINLPKCSSTVKVNYPCQENCINSNKIKRDLLSKKTKAFLDESKQEQRISSKTHTEGKKDNTLEENNSKDESVLKLMNQKTITKIPEYVEEIVAVNGKGCCEHCLGNVTSLETEHDDQCNGTDISFSQCKQFPVLPGQTTILEYFKRPNTNNILTTNSTNSSPSDEKCSLNVDEPIQKDDKNTTPKKKVLINKEVVAKSLRGNRRPSLYTDNNLNSSNNPECVTFNKSGVTKKENVAKSCLVENLSQTEFNRKLPVSKKRKSTSPFAELKRQKKDSIFNSPEKVNNLKSPIKTTCRKANEDNGRYIVSPDKICSELPVRNCYVKLFKLPTPNFSGWDNDSGKCFTGFTDTDVLNAESIKCEFVNFVNKLYSEEEKTISPEEVSNKSQDVWLGWDVVQSRSIVVNGFLIDKYSNEK